MSTGAHPTWSTGPELGAPLLRAHEKRLAVDLPRRRIDQGGKPPPTFLCLSHTLYPLIKGWCR
jgi:N-formylglutamate amidohydrolase